VLLALVQFVVVIDASIVNVALPSIGAHLHFSRTDLSWVVNACTLTFGGLPAAARRTPGRRARSMAHVRPRTRRLLDGFPGERPGSVWRLAGGGSSDQGAGAAIVSPAALAILTTTFAEGAERNRALGIWGAVAGAGGAAGVLLGGVLTSGLNWRWVLFVNLPLGILAAFMAPRVLVESRSADADRNFDIPGAVTVTAGLGLLIYGMVQAVNDGWGSTQTIPRLSGAVVLLGAFVIIELRSRKLLVPFASFRLRTLRGANIVGLLIGMSLFSMFFFISLYLQDTLHYSAIRTGVAYLPMTAVIMLAAGAASPFVTRFGFKPLLVPGMLMISGGLLWFSRVPAVGGTYAADVLGPSLLAAAGLGLAFVTVTVAAVTGTKPREAGLASGLINANQQIGGALGLAVLATLANTRTIDVIRTQAVHTISEGLTKGYERAFLVGSGFALAGALLALLLISARENQDHALAAQPREAPAPAG
jgi:MFS family permease